MQLYILFASAKEVVSLANLYRLCKQNLKNERVVLNQLGLSQLQLHCETIQ